MEYGLSYRDFPNKNSQAIYKISLIFKFILAVTYVFQFLSFSIFQFKNAEQFREDEDCGTAEMVSAWSHFSPTGWVEVKVNTVTEKLQAKQGNCHIHKPFLRSTLGHVLYFRLLSPHPQVSPWGRTLQQEASMTFTSSL